MNRRISLAVAAAAAFVGASWLLTPAEAYSQDVTVVRDLKTGITFVDRAHEWRAGEELDTVIKVDKASGTIVARYVASNRRDGRLEVEWKDWHHKGLLLAPRLFGKEVFRVDSGDGEGSSVKMVLAERPA